jgi:hypothetical protein
VPAEGGTGIVQYQLVLACLPEQVERLKRVAASLDAAIAICPLGGLEPDEIRAFIGYRLAAVDADPSLIAPDAVAEIGRRANGAPRLVNLLCAKAQLAAELSNAVRISRDAVEEAAQELGLAACETEEPAFRLDVALAAGATPTPAEMSAVLPPQAASGSASPIIVPVHRRRRLAQALARCLRPERAVPLGGTVIALATIILAASLPASHRPVDPVKSAAVPEQAPLRSSSSSGTSDTRPASATAENGVLNVAAASAAPVPARYIDDLLLRGRRLKASGDVRAARLLLSLAAADGNARAARELAETYDPRFVEKLSPESADTETAITWYERAAASGDRTARRRLVQLTQGDRGNAVVEAAR